MAELKEARVPDIGGYDDVPVIEVLVAVGDTVKQDQGLVTLESDKATMEVPASAAGKIVELKVKLGDTVSAGDVIAIAEGEGAVVADWGLSENNRKARFYRLSARGRRQLQNREAAWRRYAAAMSLVLEPAT